jgi:NADPH:quinone reductase-like Zn-dependent oxidoreductase
MRAFGLLGEGAAPGFFEIPEPVPGPGEVLVAVTASSVNPHDATVADRTAARYLEYRYPVVLGSDVAGTVVGLGDGVTDLEPGDRVFGLVREFVAHRGTFAARVAVPRATLARTPDGVDDETAGALGVAALTALRCADVLDVRRGDTVLVNGASGGVGSYLVELLHERGALVVATARSKDAGRLAAWGSSEVVDWTSGSLVDTVRRARPAGLRALVDLVTGEPAALGELAQKLLVPDGTLVSTRHAAVATGHPGPRHDIRAGADREILGRMADLASRGALRSTVTRSFPLDDVARAFEALNEGVGGKISITVR